MGVSLFFILFRNVLSIFNWTKSLLLSEKSFTLDFYYVLVETQNLSTHGFWCIIKRHGMMDTYSDTVFKSNFVTRLKDSALEKLTVYL